jgi:phage-related protein
MGMSSAGPRRRYWRLYRSSLDHRVIRDELLALPREAYAEVKAAMDDVEDFGLQASKRLRNEIREIVASDPTQGTAYRLLFAVDGRDSQILLGLVFFNKKTQKTPPRYIDLAEKRLADWRSRRQRSEA